MSYRGEHIASTTQNCTGANARGESTSEEVATEHENQHNTARQRQNSTAEQTVEKYAMIIKITNSLQDRSLSTFTADCAYTVLADALPVASCCRKPGRRQGVCDLCLLLENQRITETTRHIAIECPFSALAHEAVLRAALQTITVEAGSREQNLQLGWKDFVQEHRRLFITGYRFDHSGGSLLSEANRGETPLRVLMLEALKAIVERRSRNARLEGQDNYIPDVRADHIYNKARHALTHSAHVNWRKAVEKEENLKILNPGWQPSPGKGPVAEWENTWLASGIFKNTRNKLHCTLPHTCRQIRYAAVNLVPVSTAAIVDTHTDKTVRLRLVVTGPGGAAHPSQLTNGRNAPTPNIAWIGTVAGEARHDQAGWAYTITRPGNKQTHTPCHTIDEAYGPVVTNTRHPAYLGATAPTHTDAHLTGLAELLRALGGIKNLPAGSGIIQSTSATALAYMTGHRPPQQHLHVAAQVGQL